MQGKKILMIVPARNFNDEEYLRPRAVFDREKIKVSVASTHIGQIKGSFGTWIKADCQLVEVKPADFDAVVFVGGSGTVEYFGNSTALRIAREMNACGKIIAAICIAPAILARAGLLRGRKTACFPSETERILEGGAVLLDAGVVVDGNIITARGPENASEFGESIIRKLPSQNVVLLRSAAKTTGGVLGRK
jgi:protease I